MTPNPVVESSADGLFSSPTSRAEDGLFLPEGASFPTRLRVAIRCLRVLDKKPDDPVAQPLFNASLDGDVFLRHVKELAQTEDGRELLRDRPSLQASNVDLPALGKLPDGTMGREFARYFEVSKIQPFSSPYEIRNDVDFVVKWYRETHDLHHVLTGYSTEALGEMEVQAFALGNLGLRTSVLILGFAAVLTPHGLPPIWKYADKLRVAYRRGQQSENLLRFRYERHLATPVEEVRRRMRIPPLNAA